MIIPFEAVKKQDENFAQSDSSTSFLDCMSNKRYRNLISKLCKPHKHFNSKPFSTTKEFMEHCK